MITLLQDYDRFFAIELGCLKRRANEIAPGFDVTQAVQKFGTYHHAERHELNAQPLRDYVTHSAAIHFRDLANRGLILKRQAYLAIIRDEYQVQQARSAQPAPINGNDIAR